MLDSSDERADLRLVDFFRICGFSPIIAAHDEGSSMRTTVEKILTNDSAKRVANIDNAPYEVRVIVFDDEAEWHQSAEVIVFVDRTTTSLDEVRRHAVERTREFLTKALQAMNEQR
jgi:hypothetical protein